MWWLVSPQNPLKPVDGMAPFAGSAGGRSPDRQPTGASSSRDLESRLGLSRYTADTLQALRRRFPRLRFVWLMGGDNLVQIPHWERWPEIFRTVPIAVFDRPSYSLKALAGPAAKRFARHRVPAAAARRLRRDGAACLGVFPHPARCPLGDRDPVRAGENSIAQPKGAKTRIVHDHCPDARAPDQADANRDRRRILDLDPPDLEDGKAEDIVTIDLAGKTTIADYMVIASGRSARQVAGVDRAPR